MASANMLDFMVVGPSGDPVTDFSKLTRDQAAALQEITVDDYMDGRGKEAREVRKVKFKLADKGTAIMNIARLFGWIIEKQERKVIDDLDWLSLEELEAIADGREEEFRRSRDAGGGIGKRSPPLKRVA